MQQKCELNSYIIGKTLGKGTFGKVKYAIHKITNQPVAIKILEKQKIKDIADIQRILRQLYILKITQHSSLAQMYQIIQTQSIIFIIMEYAAFGQFFDYIMEGKIKSQREARYFFVQIVLGLEYLHQLKISHRDIKPQNILLDYNKRLKIVDFGLSNTYKQGQKLVTACGSPCYASPEMIKGQLYDPQLADTWSLGIVLYSMIFAKLPFEDKNTTKLYTKIKSGVYKIDKKISSQLRDLLQKLICTKPQNRYKIKQIKQHLWYQQQILIKCYGIIIGYQNQYIDNEILLQMQKLYYNIYKIKKYLQNNIKNQQTTIYYLLMKKKNKKGNPSSYDICNEHFNRISIIPKLYKINNKYIDKSSRCYSFSIDTSSSNHQTISIQQQFLTSKKLDKLNYNFKQRNCYSQIKSKQYEKRQKRIWYPQKKLKQYQYLKLLKKQKQLLQSQENNYKKLQKLIVQQKNIYHKFFNQQHLYIHVHPNTPNTPHKKKKITNLTLEKLLFEPKYKNNFQNSGSSFSNKLQITEFVQRQQTQKAEQKGEQNKKRWQTQHNKYIKKINRIQLQNNFWKKKSIQTGPTKPFISQHKKSVKIQKL